MRRPAPPGPPSERRRPADARHSSESFRAATVESKAPHRLPGPARRGWASPKVRAPDWDIPSGAQMPRRPPTGAHIACCAVAFKR